jgi:hypothetical protein
VGTAQKTPAGVPAAEDQQCWTAMLNPTTRRILKDLSMEEPNRAEDVCTFCILAEEERRSLPVAGGAKVAD